jgi:DNA-binding CsgD family transcriptional regulator
MRKHPNVTSLSDREMDVLYLIAREYSNSKIAEILFLSKNTIDSHRRNLFLKMHVHSSAGLIRRAYELKILPMEMPEGVSKVINSDDIKA